MATYEDLECSDSECFSYKTNDPRRFQQFIKGSQAFGALWDMHNIFREYLKYNDNLTEKQYEMVAEVSSKFDEVLDQNDINLDIDII